jgi:hypothetical protein
MSDCYPCRTRTQIAGAFSLPRVLDDSLPARIFVGRMSQSGRSEPFAEGAVRHCCASIGLSFEMIVRKILGTHMRSGPYGGGCSVSCLDA